MCEEFWYIILGFFICGDIENVGVDFWGYVVGEDEKDFDDLFYCFNFVYDFDLDIKFYVNIL